MIQQDLFDQGAATRCRRCGRRCQGGTGNPDARLLRRAPEGLCINCAVTEFLRTTEPIRTVLEIKGPRVLLSPTVRGQFRRLMEVGLADASFEEIDWQAVVESWELPLPAGK